MCLLEVARANNQLYLLLQTICGTGIRESELKYFTLAADEAPVYRGRNTGFQGVFS